MFHYRTNYSITIVIVVKKFNFTLRSSFKPIPSRTAIIIIIAILKLLHLSQIHN